jgi:hypothetical protein
VSNVSSSTPAAIRFLVAVDSFIEFELRASADIVGLETAAPPDMLWLGTAAVGLDAAFSLLAGDELPPEPSILPLSLAQPPTISPRTIIQIVCLSIRVPPVNGFPKPPH